MMPCNLVYHCCVLSPFRPVVFSEERKTLSRLYGAIFRANEISMKYGVWMEPWNNFRRAIWNAILWTIFVEQISKICLD